MSSRDASGCFNEQRTGKTPTCLVACTKHGCKKILIVTTKTGLYVWADECVNWINMPCIVCKGTLRRRRKLIDALAHAERGALVISYDSLKQTATAKGCVQELVAAHPDAILLDEAHKIKNRRSDRSAALSFFKNVPFKIALTGTLAHGKSIDMWNVLNFLFPSLFKSYWAFVEEYFFTSRNINSSGQTYVNVLFLKPDKEKELQVFLGKVSTNRKRKDPDVMPWLPEVDKQKIRLPLTAEQIKYINDLETVWETGEIITKGILDRLMRYRQICLAPALLNLKGSSPKLEWVKDYIEEYPDRPTIIFTKFTSFIKLIQHELPDVGVIIGDTPAKQREALRKEFQSGKRNHLILNLDACKENMTLDRAECAVFCDKYPPIGDIQQAEDRFIATTEDRASKPHLIIELMMKGSYDEHLYKMLELHKSETDVINNYKSYLERRNNPNANRS